MVAEDSSFVITSKDIFLLLMYRHEILLADELAKRSEWAMASAAIPSPLFMPVLIKSLGASLERAGLVTVEAGATTRYVVTDSGRAAGLLVSTWLMN